MLEISINIELKPVEIARVKYFISKVSVDKVTDEFGQKMTSVVKN